jgi:hypothetical protein
MSDPAAAHAFLLSEVETLEPFDFVTACPSGRPLHMVEITRREDAGLEVRVPGRPPILPEIPIAIRGALRDRGFASEEPADQTRPWSRAAASVASAVELLQELHIQVFGEKPGAKLDITHGSHRLEHDARQKLSVARARIESIATDLLGRRPEQDDDGDYVLPLQDVRVVVAPRAGLDGQIVVRVFAICTVGVNVTPELGLFLARLNFGLMFGRFALDVEHRSIWFDETLLGEEFREEELRFAIRIVGATADEWDDRFKQMFGGATYQEVLAGNASGIPPKTKPGQGTGQYL